MTRMTSRSLPSGTSTSTPGTWFMRVTPSLTWSWCVGLSLCPVLSMIMLTVIASWGYLQVMLIVFDLNVTKNFTKRHSQCIFWCNLQIQKYTFHWCKLSMAMLPLNSSHGRYSQRDQILLAARQMWRWWQSRGNVQKTAGVRNNCLHEWWTWAS